MPLTRFWLAGTARRPKRHAPVPAPSLPLVELRAHGLDAPPRYAVGLAVLRADEAPLSQAQKHRKGTVRKDMPLARVTGDRAYFAARAFFVVDCATQSEFMQNTLFVL